MAAMFYAMAQAYPGNYEKLVKELHRKGEHPIGDYTVKPNSLVADTMYEVKPSESRFTQLQMWEADWIALAVTRSGESWLAFDGLGTGGTDQLKSVNWPGLMADLTHKVAGFTKVESVDTSMTGLVVKKSWLGQLHDRYSNSDLVDLLKIDELRRAGKHILLMIDYKLLTRQADYGVSEAQNSHWIAYEGDLQFFDKDGKITHAPEAVASVRFKVYSWGTNPQDGLKISRRFRSPGGVRNSVFEAVGEFVFA